MMMRIITVSGVQYSSLRLTRAGSTEGGRPSDILTRMTPDGSQVSSAVVVNEKFGLHRRLRKPSQRARADTLHDRESGILCLGRRVGVTDEVDLDELQTLSGACALPLSSIKSDSPLSRGRFTHRRLKEGVGVRKIGTCSH